MLMYMKCVSLGYKGHSSQYTYWVSKLDNNANGIQACGWTCLYVFKSWMSFMFWINNNAFGFCIFLMCVKKGMLPYATLALEPNLHFGIVVQINLVSFFTSGVVHVFPWRDCLYWYREQRTPLFTRIPLFTRTPIPIHHDFFYIIHIFVLKAFSSFQLKRKASNNWIFVFGSKWLNMVSCTLFRCALHHRYNDLSSFLDTFVCWCVEKYCFNFK